MLLMWSFVTFKQKNGSFEHNTFIAILHLKIYAKYVELLATIFESSSYKNKL